MDYKIIRSSRKSVAIQISPDGEVIVRCPNRMSRKDIQAIVDSKANWIQSHLLQISCRPAEQPFTAAELEALARQAKQVLPQRCAHFAKLVGVEYNRITIRAQHSRWGSCSGNGNLNFNCLLVLAPPAVQDYVVVHELCHRKEMNHSPAFWQEVAQILPNYASQRKWLKEEGRRLIARLPK